MAQDTRQPLAGVKWRRGRRLRGVLLWNVWEKLDEATALLAEAGPFKAEDLKGRITD